eukprot:3827716-Amphidinium_carterae.1
MDVGSKRSKFAGEAVEICNCLPILVAHLADLSGSTKNACDSALPESHGGHDKYSCDTECSHAITTSPTASAQATSGAIFKDS